MKQITLTNHFPKYKGRGGPIKKISQLYLQSLLHTKAEVLPRLRPVFFNYLVVLPNPPFRTSVTLSSIVIPYCIKMP